MKRALIRVAMGLAWCACAAALPQQESQGSGHTDTVPGQLTVRGQVYAPDGTQLQRSVPLHLHSGDSTRAPEIFFTDSGGRFILPRVDPWREYVLTIEADGKNWRRTVFRFRLIGNRAAMIHVRLELPEGTVAPPGATVSASALKRKIPSAARKEFEAAVKCLGRRNHAEARRRLERAILLFPDYVEAHNEIAAQLMKSGNLAHAEEHLRFALKVDPDATPPLLNLGLCLQCQDRFADAQPYLEKAVQLRPDHPGGLLLLGINYAVSGEENRAEPLWLRAYELGGASVARAQYLLAQLYARRKDYARAALALETYLRDVPGAADGPRLQQILEQLRAAAHQH